MMFSQNARSFIHQYNAFLVLDMNYLEVTKEDRDLGFFQTD